MKFNIPRLTFSLIVALLLLIFTSQNLHTVWIRFIAGSPVQLPLIIVIIGSVIVGYALSTFNHIIRATRHKRKKQIVEDD